MIYIFIYDRISICWLFFVKVVKNNDMTRVLKVLKNEVSLPLFVIIIGLVIGGFHVFSYLVPFTDNAFVVTNVTPIAADVSGYITDIYVKNGQKVRKDDPLFTVYQQPYKLAYEREKG